MRTKGAIIILREDPAGGEPWVAEMLRGTPLYMHTVSAALETGIFDYIACLSAKKEWLDVVQELPVRTILYKENECLLSDEELVGKYASLLPEVEYMAYLDPLFPCREPGILKEMTAYFEEVFYRTASVQTAKKEYGYMIPLSSVRLCKNRRSDISGATEYFLIENAQTVHVTNDWYMECAFAWCLKHGGPKSNDAKVTRIIQEKKHSEKRPVKNGVLLVGHSIFSYWNVSALMGLPVCNMGIAGITTKDYYEKVICQNHITIVPDIVFINLGINDTRYSDSRTTVYYIQKIIDWLHEQNNECRIWCIKQHHTFYRRAYPDKEIDMINREMDQLEGVAILDCSLMENEYGHLKYEHTTDGLHFNENGYETFRRILENGSFSAC